MVETIVANYFGHEILGENTWFRGARLFVDGECRDENDSLFSLQKDVPLLRADLVVDRQIHTIEVFCFAILTVKIKVCVNGKPIGGELF